MLRTRGLGTLFVTSMIGLAVLFAALPTAASRKPVGVDGVGDHGGQAVFRVTYENFAWGHTKESCEIRSTGEILRAEFSVPPDRILGYERIGTLPAGEIAEMINMLESAAGHGLTEPVYEMSDFGSITWIGLLDQDPVILQITGDSRSENPSPAGLVLTALLMEIFLPRCSFIQLPK